MKTTLKAAVVVVGFALAAGASGLVWLEQHGLSGRDQPTGIEAFVARHLRHLAVPRAARDTRNPLPPTPEALGRGRSHFADHCASCHGNDGRGRTTLGQNLYPKAPDMTRADTQDLSDGEIFYVIENGVRFTGMPAWGEAGVHDTTQSWELVLFVRHLPKITAQEMIDMDSLNPKTRKQLEDEEATQRFLAGEGDQPTASEEEHRH